MKMRTCQEIAGLATEFAEGTLPFGRRLEVRLHLWICAACRGFFAQLHATRALLGRLRGSADSGDEAALLRDLRL
ncbi:MAG: zf-HC2 domain-containing protein [Deltaproteobacteria bacterium]